MLQRGVDAAQDLPAEVVYIGISLGAMPATQLAQTKPGEKYQAPDGTWKTRTSAPPDRDSRCK